MLDSDRQYISLQEATKYCSYTQEYLSLRARQGKMKAMKIGRNWVTREEWVKEYAREAEAYAKHIREKNAREISAQLKEIKAPETELPKLELPELKLPKIKLPEFKFPELRLPDLKPYLKPALNLGLVSLLVVAGVSLSKVDFSKIAANVSQSLSQENLKDSARETAISIGEYSQWLEETIFGSVKKIVLAYSEANGYVEEKLISLISAPKNLSFEWRLPKIQIHLIGEMCLEKKFLCCFLILIS